MALSSPLWHYQNLPDPIAIYRHAAIVLLEVHFV